VSGDRAPDQENRRPSLASSLWRGLLTALWTAFALLLLAWILPGFEIDSPADALLAAVVIGVLNGIVWPALSSVVVPVSILTLGIGAIVIDALAVWWLFDVLPGVHVDGFWSAVAIVIGLVIVATIAASVMVIDDDEVFDHEVRMLARRRRAKAVATEVPGIVFIQLDGVAQRVLQRAIGAGDVPTIHRWVNDGRHRLVGWTTGWSSQTGVSQCGILHGSTADMPAFRWVDKATGDVVVSNHPKWARAIEVAHSDGNGLLSHAGSSYGNLFSGDAERAVLTMSGIARRKEGRLGAGYLGYFSKPQKTTRTLVGMVSEIARERRAAAEQRRRGVEPRVHRGWSYSFLRAFTTIIARDVSVQGVINDMCEGRAAIYVDLLGYDEVAHHSGPERSDTIAVLRDLDRQIARIGRAAQWAPRPYHVVVLSDHGQTQGATFAQRTGETLRDLVSRLCGAASSGDSDAEDGKTESTAWLRHARAADSKPQPDRSGVPIVLGSGNLGLISLPGDQRLSREEIDVRYPDLIPGLLESPAVGFVLVRSNDGTSSVLGAHGSRNLATGTIDGEDPLARFGRAAVRQVTEVDGYSTVADVMVNSLYDPVDDEVAAFEEQVGSHGGLGGPQTHPFLLYPTVLSDPPQEMFGSPAVYRVLKGWLREVGQPVTVESARTPSTPLSLTSAVTPPGSALSTDGGRARVLCVPADNVGLDYPRRPTNSSS
jgi:uncharacterized membrane protein YvlD (DUF360 family)